MALMKGVFTSISGKVGNVIYCKTGPNQIIKTGFVPGNPKTAAQTSDRNLFSLINSTFKVLNDEVVQPFWKPFCNGSQKAWSSFISANKKSMLTDFDVKKSIITKGSLEPAEIDYVAYDETEKTLNVNWKTRTIQNGKAGDDISILVFDHNINALVYYDLKCAIRSDRHYTINLISPFTGTNLTVFAFASQDSASGNSISLVSNSESFDIGDYGLVMKFVDNAVDTSTIQLKDLDDNACKVDWGDGNLQDISTSSETESLITPTYVKIYSQNGLSYFKSSNNNFSFDIASLPSVMTYFECYSSNTVIGDIASLPSVMTSFTCGGSNTVSGDIASLPSAMTYFYCAGSNTLSGDIASLPSVMDHFYCTGSNTVIGDIASLPSVMTYFLCVGSNTVSGDISSLPSVMTYFYCSGSNTISVYTSPRVWSNNMRYVLSLPKALSGLDSTEVDNLLINLSDVVSWASDKIIDISGNNAARTSDSDDAVTILEGKGVTVTTN